MLRCCSICNQVKNSPYKNMCRNCYWHLHKHKIKEKECPSCGDIFKKDSTLCYSCERKQRIEKDGIKTCSRCGRENMLIMNKKLCLCNTCNRHKRENEDPIYKIKRKVDNRIFSRKRRGTPLDMPLRVMKETWRTKTGYILTYKPNHPNSNCNGCIFQHTFIMSEHLGRALIKGENVHHINGMRDDNRVENLELWHKSQPPGQRIKEKIDWCIKLLESYGFKVDNESSIKV